jgi:hypothetical protein
MKTKFAITSEKPAYAYFFYSTLEYAKWLEENPDIETSPKNMFIEFEKVIKGEIDIPMTLKEFFEEFTADEIVDLYVNRIQDDIAKESLKEILMERLELLDDESFELWLKLQ